LSYRISLITLGCPKNLVDSEIMLGMLREEGFTPVTDLNEAEAVIVNTCSFVADAREEAVTSILEAARLKDNASLKVLAVTGCMAERYKDEIIKEIPEVDLVFGTGSISKVSETIKAILDGKTDLNAVWCDIPDSVDYLDSTRILSDQRPYAYLKIAEGCSNRCTYCIIPSLRGDYRSRSMESILKEAAFLAEHGKKEIVLVAQDVTRYGMDIYGEKRLVDLINGISPLQGVERIRLLYCYPELVDDRLIDALCENTKLQKYLDIPIQHISDHMLKAMGRRSSRADIESLIQKLKARIPDIILRTSLIAGFPGETEEDHQELLEFVKKGYFQHLGVFAYSREEGTPAYKLKGQIPKKIKEMRRDTIMAAQQENVMKFNSSRIHHCYDTMVEGVADDGIFYYGRTYAEAPEIDPVIYFTAQAPLENGDTVSVKMICTDAYDLIGEVVGK
jgi:ribosomal protein S12 methylthiotransferase